MTTWSTARGDVGQIGAKVETDRAHCVPSTGRAGSLAISSRRNVTGHGQARFSCLDRQTELRPGFTCSPRVAAITHMFARKRDSRQRTARRIRFCQRQVSRWRLQIRSGLVPFFASLSSFSRSQSSPTQSSPNRDCAAP